MLGFRMGIRRAFPVIDEATAEFLPFTIEVTGSDVLDADTEVNVPASIAFLGQETPTLAKTAQVVFLIRFGDDFTQEQGYKIMTIKVTGEMVMGDEEGEHGVWIHCCRASVCHFHLCLYFPLDACLVTIQHDEKPSSSIHMNA